MKKILFFVCTLLCANVLLAQVGTTFGIGDIQYEVTSTNPAKVEVNDANTSITIANIPETVNYEGTDYSVTSIGNSAFSAHFNLTSVTIPNSVISIENLAFFYCSSLTSVSIGNSVASIGDRAFSYCSGLTSVNIPNSVITIGGYAFESCSNLSSITLPVTSIGDYAFLNCSGLTSITIPNTVVSIKNGAFQNCSGLTSVIIPNSVTSLGAQVFAGCVNLTSVTIPNSITSIGASAFLNCSGLTSIVIPNSVTSLGAYAFSDCSALTSVTCLRETSPSTGNNVFASTPSNKTLTIPFNASGYTSNWGNTTWQKIYHKINKGETKTLTNTFEITEENKRQIINEGVLRIKQGGQLINQTATNVEGIIEIEAINRANNWNYIGAPFANIANNYQLGAILPQANDVSVSTFNHSTGSWSSEWATYNDVINTGESFAAWNWGASPITFTTYGDIWNYETNQAGGYNFEQDPTYTLNNQPEITIAHQDGNPSDGVNWLSVANPYTFKLDVEKIINQNSLQGNVLYKYNGTTFIPVSSGEIQVTEGFFVNNQSITLNKAQQHTLSAKTKKQKDYIRLAVNDGENEIELQFTHNEDAKQDYDLFDANKLFSPKEITEPYFVTDGNALVKEEVKELPYTATLNIKSYENKDITIKITNIPEGVNVYLLDNDQDTKMNGDVEYTTTITAGENADRFKILFKPQQKLETKQNNHITINNHNRHITITSTITDLNIEVYNALGQKVYTTKDYTFTLDHLPSGSYLIKAFKGRQTKTEKIVIE